MNNRYNPYNKTYKYICLQHQIAHTKNKSLIRSLGQSNILIISKRKEKKNKDIQTSASCFWSPKKCRIINKQQRQKKRPEGKQQRQNCESKIKSYEKQIMFVNPYRIVHKNHAYEQRTRERLKRQNKAFSSRLLSASCSVVTRDETNRHFEQHKELKKIAQKYQTKGPRKDLLALRQKSLTASHVRDLIKQRNHFCTLLPSSIIHFHNQHQNNSCPLNIVNNHIVKLK